MAGKKEQMWIFLTVFSISKGLDVRPIDMEEAAENLPDWRDRDAECPTIFIEMNNEQLQ